MRPWGFVSLAYGIVWGAIAVYVFLLKRRYHTAQTELGALGSAEQTNNHVKE
ncbi:MAG TPA: CcmD family protein [Candidatus Binatia bacterium]